MNMNRTIIIKSMMNHKQCSTVHYFSQSAPLFDCDAIKHILLNGIRFVMNNVPVWCMFNVHMMTTVPDVRCLMFDNGEMVHIRQFVAS